MNTKREILFVVNNVAGWEKVQTETPSHISVYALDAQSNALQQMADILASKTDISGIHLISHGAEGTVNLGSVNLSSSNINQYQTQLSIIGNALTSEGDFLLYGCDIASGSQGKLFVNQLAMATQADIASSDNKTGTTNQGGDWTLEVTNQLVTTDSLGYELLTPLGWSWDAALDAIISGAASVANAVVKAVDVSSDYGASIAGTTFGIVGGAAAKVVNGVVDLGAIVLDVTLVDAWNKSLGKTFGVDLINPLAELANLISDYAIKPAELQAYNSALVFNLMLKEGMSAEQARKFAYDDYAQFKSSDPEGAAVIGYATDVVSIGATLSSSLSTQALKTAISLKAGKEIFDGTVNTLKSSATEIANFVKTLKSAPGETDIYTKAYIMAAENAAAYRDFKYINISKGDVIAADQMAVYGISQSHADKVSMALADILSNSNTLKSKALPVGVKYEDLSLSAAFRSSNPDSLPHINKGHSPKPEEIKSNTMKLEDYILNPAFKDKSVSLEQFDKDFKGLVAVYEPDSITNDMATMFAQLKHGRKDVTDAEVADAMTALTKQAEKVAKNAKGNHFEELADPVGVDEFGRIYSLNQKLPDGTTKYVTGDYDPFNFILRDKNGNEIKLTEEERGIIVTELTKREMIEHPGVVDFNAKLLRLSDKTGQVDDAIQKTIDEGGGLFEVNSLGVVSKAQATKNGSALLDAVKVASANGTYYSNYFDWSNYTSSQNGGSTSPDNGGISLGLNIATDGWTVETVDACCGQTGQPATWAYENGKLIVTTKGVSNGFMGIPDGSVFTPLATSQLPEDFSVQMSVTELERTQAGGYKDNSGIGLNIESIVKQNAPNVGLSIAIFGNYSGYYDGHAYNQYHGHRIDAAVTVNGVSTRIIHKELDLSKLYEDVQFRITQKDDVVYVGYRIDSSSDWTDSVAYKNDAGLQFSSMLSSWSGDGGNTSQNGSFKAAVNSFSLIGSGVIAPDVPHVYNDHTYMLVDGATWTDAEAAAVAKGGHLVTINDKAENDWLVNTFGDKNHYLIGLTDREQEGVWKWISGEPVGFTNWIQGQPDNYPWVAGGEDYVHFHSNYSGKWNDLNLEKTNIVGTFFGIAEINPAGTITTPEVVQTYTPTFTATNTTEGNSGEKSMVFTLTLDKAANQDITATYATRQANSTATNGDDYKTVYGTVTIVKGQTSATINVPIIGDTKFEGDETVTLLVTNVKGAKFADGATNITASGTILNDDIEPLPMAEINDSYKTEGDVVGLGYRIGQVKVTLDHAYSKDITIGYVVEDGSATYGTDYQIPGLVNKSGVVNIKAGETVGTIEYWVKGDIEIENTENFTIKLNHPDANVILSDAAFESVVHILDNDYFRDTRAPILLQQSIKDNLLFLTYSENLSDISPDARQFSVKVGDSVIAATKVAVVANQMVVTLAENIERGEEVTLNYQDNDNLFTIQDIAGNESLPQADALLSHIKGLNSNKQVFAEGSADAPVTVLGYDQSEVFGLTGGDETLFLLLDLVSENMDKGTWKGSVKADQHIEKVDVFGLPGDQIQLFAEGNVVFVKALDNVLAEIVVQDDADGTQMRWQDSNGDVHSSQITIKATDTSFGVYADDYLLSSAAVSLMVI